MSLACRFQKHFRRTIFRYHFMRNRPLVFQTHRDDILFRVGFRFRNRLLDVNALRNANTNAPALVAKDDRATETETLAARNHACHAAHVEHFLSKFFAYGRAIARTAALVSLWHWHSVGS